MNRDDICNSELSKPPWMLHVIVPALHIITSEGPPHPLPLPLPLTIRFLAVYFKFALMVHPHSP